MKNPDKILFISDSSILNPILKSQGIPLYLYLSNLTEVYFLSFEKSINDYKKFIELSNQLKKSKINFLFTEINKTILPSFIITFLKGIITIYKLVKINNIKIIHARSLLPGIIAVSIKLFIRDIKVVYDIRGVVIEEELFKGKLKKYSVKYFFYKLSNFLNLKYSDSIVVVSEKMQAYFANRFDYKNKFNVIPNRTNIDSKLSLNIRKNNNRINAIYSGSMAKWQNPEFLNKMQSVIDNNKLPIDIYVYTYQIEEAKKILDPNIFIDSLSSEKRSEVYLMMNFAILVRQNILINNVASPLKFAEYLAFGLPVLISPGIGDYSEEVAKNKIGIVVNNNLTESLTEMIKLLESENIYDRCYNYAKENLNISSSFQSYEKIFKEVMNK